MSSVSGMEKLRNPYLATGAAMLAIGAGALLHASRAEAISAGSVEPSVTPTDFDGDGTLESVRYAIDFKDVNPDGNDKAVLLDNATFNISANDGSSNETVTVPSLLSGFFSGDRPEGWGLNPGVWIRDAQGHYNGQAFKFVFVSNPESGNPVTAIATLNASNANGPFSLPSQSVFTPNPNAQPSPGGNPNPPDTNNGNTNTPPAPVCEVKVSSLATTARLLNKNGRGVLRTGLQVSGDSTGRIDGQGLGNSTNNKVRNSAAHIDVKIGGNVAVLGKLPRNMIALRGNKPVKKNQLPNLISIDVPNGGVNAGKSFMSSLKYRIVKGKNATFTVIPRVPGSRVDFADPACGTVNLPLQAAKAQAKIK